MPNLADADTVLGIAAIALVVVSLRYHFSLTEDDTYVPAADRQADALANASSEGATATAGRG
jgi:hypothetical protein